MVCSVVVACGDAIVSLFPSGDVWMAPVPSADVRRQNRERGSYLTIGNWCWVGDHATLYTLGEITIDENTVISHHAYLCTASHDYTRPTFDQFAKAIHVESEAWIATNVFVGPGVTIGRGAVVGACSVVLKDVPANIVCAGNPLKVLRTRVTETE
jgi:putative colanic acid biosynthesis acetyltransferase WcaF